MKKYCINCGSATEFSFNKPKFCTNCGKSFDIGLAVEVKENVIKKPINNMKKPQINIEENDLDLEDGEDVLSVPEISKIDCDYEVKKHQGIKFKKMMDNPFPSLASSSKEKKVKGKKLSKKEVQQFLEDFKKESGSIRPKK